jgi:hypothetical protein
VPRKEGSVVDKSDSTGLEASNFSNTKSSIESYLDQRKKQKKLNTLVSKETKALKTNQDKLRKELEEKIIQSEKQHVLLKQSLEQEAIIFQQQIEVQEKSINNNKKNELKINHKDDKELARAKIKSVDVDPRQKMIHESRQEIERIAQFQNTVKGLESLNDTKIKSEFAFERRHEVKDEPGSPMNTKFIPLAHKDRQAMEDSIKQLKHEQKKLHKLSGPRFIKDLRTSTDSVELLRSGAFGVIVGIVIFIIFYALR